MWKATLANLRAHRLRLTLTALSIVLGVAFVTGTLIFTDTLHNTFDQLFSGVYGKISVQVRQPSPVNDQFGDKSFIPMPDVDPARRSPACRAWRRRRAPSPASPNWSTSTTRPSRRMAPPPSAPATGLSRRYPASPWPQGHAPQGPDQVVIDKGTADKYGFKVGDPIEILFQGPPQRFTIVGIVKFGKANGLGGATVAEFDLPVAQQLLNRVGTFDAVNLLASPGVSPTTLQATVAPHLPSRLPGRHRVPAGQGERQPGQQEPLGDHRLPAGVRPGLAVRRVVHHPQHLLDPGGPADQGVRPVPGARGQP